MDLLEGRPNVLEIILGSQNHALLTSPFNYVDPGKGYDVDTSLPLGFQKLVTRRLLSKDTRRLLARFSYACQWGPDAIPKAD
jgi:hypothetical protein